MLAVLALVAFYPALRYDALRRFYLAAELAALCVGIGALVQWIGREAPRLPHAVTACVLAVELEQMYAEAAAEDEEGAEEAPARASRV